MSARFIVSLPDGATLHRFDIGWWNECQDDPACWDSRAESPKTFTAKQIEKMRPLLRMFQGNTFTVTEVQS